MELIFFHDIKKKKVYDLKRCFFNYIKLYICRSVNVLYGSWSDNLLIWGLFVLVFVVVCLFRELYYIKCYWIIIVAKEGKSLCYRPFCGCVFSFVNNIYCSFLHLSVNCENLNIVQIFKYCSLLCFDWWIYSQETFD